MMDGRLAGSGTTETVQGTSGNPDSPFVTEYDADVVTGHLDGVDDEGRLLFRQEGERRSVPVAIGLTLPDDALVQAATLGRRALVVRTGEARPRLILVGLVRERVSGSARDSDPGVIHAQVDGETVRLSADKRIELTCGKARLVLDRDGRIELSGSYVLTRSRGPVKLKGATVEIN